ncbi:MAG: dihydroorotate dehydrogenase [Spirochaetaceae bacterium]|jgi:dihydroorotate dehydrogenase (NAD+) catalytic subunit|nr:dihydroorotate dehydrogenase [Spirochaetaceae bacterium]
MNLLETTAAGIRFKNPLILASGSCGFGREYAELFDPGKLGGICSKGLTLRPRTGNSGIRIWESSSGIMNSVGLENPGVETFIREELPFMQSLGTAVIVNLSGHTIDDYLEGAELLNHASFDMLELNISCPNVKEGGMSFGIKTETARDLIHRVRKVSSHILAVKLSPNAEDISALARACEEEGADCVSLVNTFPALAVDLEKRKPVFDNVYAGLSGPAIKPIALRMVHQVSQVVSIPVMGMGGITSAEDALEFIMAGASLVQTGTASFIKPDISLDILSGMEKWLASHNIHNIEEIRGLV